MIIEQELKAVELSPVKKDFYQIWNELLDVASKLSERWDPSSTNESDPGIVLLKVLTALGDKLNYNIDKNILEAFMPSASQEESMRKLCDMLGYNMKYYQSATTKVRISYTGSATEVVAAIPIFTPISDIDNLITYTTITPATLIKTANKQIVDTLYVELDCIEGSHQVCETNNGQKCILYSLLDDNYRYYLPESMIAENGIFVYDYAEEQSYSNRWAQVDNLNTQPGGTKCYKFGFDSKLRVPYLQFPEDVGIIMPDGIEIHYIRTTGVAGNISARTLNQITSTIYNTDETATETDITKELAIANLSAAMNGKNAETINQAYNNFKKTIGTFDTLVTCRDYMNKIYNLFNDVTNIPLVSNIVVADVRDDINRAFTLCELSDYGIKYTNMKTQDSRNKDRINNFDLVLYPFKTIYGTNTETEYKDSFKYTDEQKLLIESGIEKNKTLAHNIIYPDTSTEGIADLSKNDITCIKNYLKLSAKITTNTKVNTAEELSVLSNIYKAITAAFNMRELDFGEEIPFDSILQVIEGADSRIKNVSLEDPELYTTIQIKAENADTGVKEINVSTATTVNNSSQILTNEDVKNAKKLLNKLTLRNILAGRIAAFDYNTSFKRAFNEQAYGQGSIQPEYPINMEETNRIVKLESECKIPVSTDDFTVLTDNEVVSFRAPNFKTVKTYPAYVNYFLHLAPESTQISADTEYRLRDGEWLAINYTTSNADEDGQSQETIVNKVFSGSSTTNESIIIKPNLDLTDSTQNEDAPTKTTGYYFSQAGVQDTINAKKGMYTLGTNEQIEIRTLARVTFNGPSYFYWVLNPSNATAQDDCKDLGKKFEGGTSYILEEGEYFYYTDAAKVSMAGYGAGTEIILTTPKTPEDPTGEIAAEELRKALKISDKATAVPIESLINMQLQDIPWVYINLTDTSHIDLQEYQYINLTKEDKVKNILNTATTPSVISTLSNDWCTISAQDCQYADGNAVILPKIDLDNTDNYGKWEVRSRLEFNMGPAVNQTLYNTYDKITMIPEATSVVATTLSPVTITQSGTTVTLPLTLKSNYRIQKGDDQIDVSVTTRDVNGNLVPLNDFRISTCKIDNENQYYLLNNKSNYWTELNVADLSMSSVPYVLHANLPAASTIAENYGLIAFKNSANAALTITSSGTTGRLAVFNDCYSITDITDVAYATTVTIPANSFREIQIANSTAITIPGCDIQLSTAATKGVIIFSQLDVVKGINPQLNYQAHTTYDNAGTTATLTAEQQLLWDIHQLGDTVQDNFYYNTLLDNSTAIDIDKDEFITDPKYLYDYNNINNKFVISEIDYDSMKEGITIARSSKL